MVNYNELIDRFKDISGFTITPGSDYLVIKVSMTQNQDTVRTLIQESNLIIQETRNDVDEYIVMYKCMDSNKVKIRESKGNDVFEKLKKVIKTYYKFAEFEKREYRVSYNELDEIKSIDLTFRTTEVNISCINSLVCELIGSVIIPEGLVIQSFDSLSLTEYLTIKFEFIKA